MLVAHLIALIGVLQSCAGVQRTYTNEWAVKISGGLEVANEIASRHGFENRGTVAGLADVYLFALNDHPKMSASSFAHKSRMLISTESKLNTGTNTRQRNTAGVAGRDINVQPVWIQGITGCNVTVGVVDDGVECTHPDLVKNYITSLGWNYLEQNSNPFPGSTSGIRDSHGTSCAGEIGMQKNNTFCGAGVAYNAGVTGIRLIGGNGASDVQEANALSHINNFILIYSNSWGPSDNGKLVSGPGTVTKMALQNDVIVGRGGKGSIFVWAAGNGGANGDSCAADGYVNSIYTIAIGSASSTGGPAFYDEPCSAKFAVAFVNNPGVPTLQVSTTTTFGRCTDTFGGTSSATPLVSGVVALVLEANSKLTWRDIQYLIVYTANPNILNRNTGWATNGAGRQFHLYFGFGAVDAEAMVTRARRWILVPEQRNDTVSIATTSPVNARSNTSYSFRYSAGAVTYLESVVITTTLTITGLSGTTDSTSNRGAISISLTSPNRTMSTLLPNRPNDNMTNAAYFNWPFKSLHFWGENPAGTWTLTVAYSGALGSVTVANTKATFYGTSKTPQAVASIPVICDPACARGCSGPGPGNCDVCTAGYLRDVVTLRCIKNCITGRAMNGYCYNPSDPDPVCVRSNPPGNALGTCSTKKLRFLA